MENYNELKGLIASIEEDANKFYVKNNKAAGLRLRKGLKEIKNFVGSMTSEILTISKTL